MNIVSFKFFAIEFNNTAFEMRNITVPSIINIEFDFYNKFSHSVTNPMFIGSNEQRIRYREGVAYKLLKYDVDAKVGKYTNLTGQ